jgi:predicted DNA-binding transcriptional regulator AlpA
MRLKSVLAVTAIGKSKWWAGVKDGSYPQPLRGVTPNCTVWRAQDVRKLISLISEGGHPQPGDWKPNDGYTPKHIVRKPKGTAA